MSQKYFEIRANLKSLVDVFRGGHMNILVAAFDVALFLVAAVVLGLEVPYWAYKAIHRYRVHHKLHATR